MVTARDVYQRALRAAGMPGLYDQDWPYQSPSQHAATQPPAARPLFERAVRFAWLLSEERCRETMREAARALRQG